MEKQITIIPDELMSAADVLIENLSSAEPFVRYERAAQRLKSDHEASGMLEKASSLQAKIRSAQVSGSFDQQELENLRHLQSHIQENQSIADYSRAQQGAVNYLREVNQEISQLIGVDFASLARPTSC
jgi:cell fate (sporulation/competence/biofilm development) regulator YlbF (YheA/YmcA/DUF963 family)